MLVTRDDGDDGDDGGEARKADCWGIALCA
jgi:hypothetical protein